MYDYVCTVCGHRMEVIHGVHGVGPASCPVCGGQMRKAFVPPTIHFKGSGWAKKDRGSSVSTKAAAKATAGAEAEGASSDASAPAAPTQGSPSGSAKGSHGEGSSSGADAAAGPASATD